MSTRFRRCFRSRCATIVIGFGFSVSILADAPLSAAPVAIDLPKGDVLDALALLSRQAHISVGMAGQMPRLRTPAVKGVMEPAAAFEALLAETDWQAVPGNGGLWLLRRRRKARHDSPPPSAEAPHSQTIVVTATKRDEELSVAPTSIAVIPGGLFGGGTLARGTSDIASQTEGAFTTNLGPGRDRIFLRGVADSAFNGPTQSTVGLFLDDARINYAMPDPDLRLVDIARIEVLRGPQGTLYGTGALGGIVRIITNRPDLDRLSGSIAAEATAVQQGAAGGAVEAVVNMPIVRGRLAVRAVGYGDSAPGWIDDVERNRSNINRVNRTGGRIDIRLRVGAEWTIDASGIDQDLEARDSQYATSGFDRATAIAEPHHNRLVVGRLEAKGPIGPFDFVSTTAIEGNQVTSRFDAGSVAASRQLGTPLAFDDTRHLTLIAQEFRLSDPRGRRPWVVGASVDEAINRSAGTFEPPVGPAVVARDLYARSIEGAVFGEATQALGRKFGLTVGLRMIHSSDKDQSASVNGLDATKTGFTPSATLAWHPAPTTLVWLRYASAVRPGGLSEDGSGKATIFQSDVLKSLELGSRLTLLNGAATLNTAFFALNWLHVQSDVIGADGLVATINAGNAHNFGVESTATISLHPFSLDLGVTAQHGRLTSSASVAGTDLRLPVLPDLSGRARLSFARDVRDYAVSAYVAANYLGPARLSFDPALDRTIPAHVQVGAGIGLGKGAWRWTLAVSNLLNSHQDTFSFGNPFTIRSTIERTPYRPRAVTLRIERRF